MLPGYRYPASLEEPLMCGDLRYSFNLSRALVRAGVAVTVLTRGRAGDSPLATFDGVSIHRYRPEAGALFSTSFDVSVRRLSLFRKLRQNADALIVNTPLSLELPVRVPRPFVYVCSGLEDVRNYRPSVREAAQFVGIALLRDPARRLTWRRADRVNTTAVQEEATLRRWGVPPARIATIGPGVEIERYHPARDAGTAQSLRRSWRVEEPDARVVLSVSRFSPAKGLVETLRAFARLCTRRPDTRLVLVGVRHSHRAGYFDRVQRTIAELGLGSRVLIRENVPEAELPAYYAAADVTSVFSTGYDPLPTVMIESMSCGTPVVSTAFATRTQVITDGVTGLFVPEKDEEAWAAAVSRVLDDPALAERLRMAALARVAETFDMNHVARQYLELLRRS
jgi:glycosyltransferase involved in cell wall biosynthesis